LKHDGFLYKRTEQGINSILMCM